ncbi:MAG: hypothetical protein JO165_06655, partial [Candidatus Eremiobacteraeota bacterium]|nr:hypothetical protein [Candidatus Eremiobacteraeota bacterium]
MASSWGSVTPVQVLDRYFSSTSQITSQAQQNPTTYGVWGSFFPSAWQAGNPNVVASLYILPMQDPNRISGHDLNWWKANHPDWILHPCDSTGAMHTDKDAYMIGSGFPDVPLDIENGEVVNYLLRQTIYPYMVANGYNAIALDNISFTNTLMVGPNPTLGEGNPISGWYACGTIDNSNVEHIHYHSTTDPQYATDVLNLVHTIKTDFTADPTINSYHFHLLANHLYTSLSDPNMQSFLDPTQGIDALLDEAGFGNYGRGQNSGSSSLLAKY